MSRTERFLSGATLGYVHLAAVTLVGLWLTPFLLMQLGERDYGLWLMALQIVAYLQLLDFGVVALLPREVAYATGRGVPQESAAATAALATRTFRIATWQAAWLACVGVCLWWLLPDSWRPLHAPFAWLLAGLVLVFPFRVVPALLQGLQDLAFLGRLQLAAWLTGTATMVLLVALGAGLYALVAGWLITQLVTVLSCSLRVRQRFANRSIHVARPGDVPGTRTYLQRSGWVSVSQLAQVLLGATDVVVIGAFAGPAAVVPYACTVKLVQVLANHPQLLMQTAAPALSQMRVAEARERLLATITALTRAVLIVSGGVACVVVAVNEAFVGWWVGAAQFGGSYLTWGVVAVMLLRHLATTMAYALFCFGHERRLSLTAVSDGLVVLAGSVVLVQRLGAPGAVVASLLGVAIVTLPCHLGALARETGTSARHLLLALRGWFVRFALALACSAALAAAPLPEAFWAVALLAAAAGGIYLALVWQAALAPPLGPYVRSGLGMLRGAWTKEPAAAVANVRTP